MQFMKIFPLFFIFLLFFPIVLAVEYPSPTGYVNDYAEIFSEQEKQEMTSILERIDKNTTVEIAVLTVKSLEGIPKDDYAVEIFKKWGIGKKDINNGLLILIAPNEREYRIEVGYGLEGTITDIQAGIIGRKNFVENFKLEKYGTGVYDAILDLKGFIEKDPTVVSEIQKYSKTGQKKAGYFSGMMTVLFLLMILSGILKAATKKQSKKKATVVKILSGILLLLAVCFIFSIMAGIMAFIFFLIFSFASGRAGGPPIFIGGGSGGFGGGFSGGFGGFGGGFSGGGGAGGGW